MLIHRPGLATGFKSASVQQMSPVRWQMPTHSCRGGAPHRTCLLLQAKPRGLQRISCAVCVSSSTCPATAWQDCGSTVGLPGPVHDHCAIARSSGKTLLR